MKCDDCLNLLEEYIDGEAIPRDAEQVSAHLITCARCAHEFERLRQAGATVGTIVPVPDCRLLMREAASCPIEDFTYSLLRFGLAAA